MLMNLLWWEDPARGDKAPDSVVFSPPGKGTTAHQSAMASGFDIELYDLNSKLVLRVSEEEDKRFNAWNTPPNQKPLKIYPHLLTTNIDEPQAELFKHPLSKVIGQRADGEPLMNLWSIASTIACIASLRPNPKAEQLFAYLVSNSNPLIDAKALLDRCRKLEPAAIRQAITLLEDGMVPS